MPLEYKGSLSRYRRYIQTIRERPLVRASLWIIFSLVLTITMVVAALKPALTTIAALIGQIEQEKIISEKLDNKIRTMQLVAKNMENIRPKLPLLNQAMPDEPEWKSLAITIEAEATSSGVNIESLIIENIPVKGTFIQKKTTTTDTQDEININGVKTLPVTISVSGEYAQMKDFIHRLEIVRRIIVLTRVSIEKDQRGKIILIADGYAIFHNSTKNDI